MAIKRFRAHEAVNERSDAEYVCTFVNGAGETIDDSAISAIVATLSDVASGTIINSRDGQNVLNAAGGTLAADGTFTLLLGRTGAGATQNDNLRVGTLDPEEHRLVLEVTFTRPGGGVGLLNHEVRFYVQDVAHIPDA
jgi:hypothetical protein